MTDVVMPEMNGRDLAKNILSLYPDLKRLFMSGYTANVIAHHGILDEGVNFIQKTVFKTKAERQSKRGAECGQFIALRFIIQKLSNQAPIFLRIPTAFRT